MARPTRSRLALAAVGSLFAAATLAPTANAAFPPANATTCQGAVSIDGIGASFQRAAQITWGAEIVVNNPAPALNVGFGYDIAACSQFELPADGGTEDVEYNPAGSGAGRTAFGANGNGDPITTPGSLTRNKTQAFGGVDEAPTAGQITQAEEGDPTRSDDDAELQVIPTASGSIPVLVQLPTGCTMSSTNRTLTREEVEGAFAASTAYDTWGELFNNSLSTPACNAATFSRVVRLDSSGTTAQLKNYLQAIVTSYGGSGTGWAALPNQDWPAAGSTTNPLVRGASNGNGPLVTALQGTASGDGGIGYADLSTARSGGYDWTPTGPTTFDSADTSFWASVQRLLPATSAPFVSPAVNNSSAATGSQLGSNCSNVEYGTSSGAFPTTTNGGDWSRVTGARTTSQYPICALTYALAWDDPEDVNFDPPAAPDYTPAEARATKDYLTYNVSTNSTTGGQRKLAAAGYSILTQALIGTTGNSVQTLATAGVNSLDWDKP